MKIKYVTLTGADDKTNIEDMILLSKKYPFVEWGILFSKSKQGVERYPSSNWINLLQKSVGINLSAHLCGKLVSNFLNCDLNLKQFEMFNRIQLNLFKKSVSKVCSSNDFLCSVNKTEKPIIVGGNYEDVALNNFSFNPLFDSSGGNGVSPKKWIKPFGNVFCGYACGS